MGRVEQLADKYRQHISLPWQQTVAGAQRVIVGANGYNTYRPLT